MAGVAPAESAARAPLSIIHVTSPGLYGGLETVVHLLASNQVRAGHAVCVILLGVDPAAARHPLADALSKSGVSVEFVPRGRPPFRDERAHVAAICRRLNANVLHTHGSRPDFIASPAGKAVGIPTVSTVHGVTVQGLKSHLLHMLEWRALRRVSAVIAVSRPLMGVLASKGVPRDRLVLIPNAFASTVEPLSRDDARRALGIPEDRFAFGWVGRLSREKGADVLVESLRSVRSPRPVIVFVGDGPERESLIELARTLGVTDDIRWLGAVPSGAALFAGFDGFVLSSRSEGTPMCLFEAMDAGIPAIVTAVGGVPDVVSDREALIVQPEQPAALAAAIDALIADRQAGRERATAARARLSAAYSVGPWIERHNDLYRKLISQTVSG